MSNESSHNRTKTYDPFVEHPVPTSVGLFTFAVAIVFLNVIAIVVFVKRRRSKPPVDHPLLSLLVANVLQGAITLPAYALKKMNAFGHQEQAVICDVYRFSFFVCAHASIMSLIVSNVDRLIALIYSLRYSEIVTKFRISMAVVFTWLFVICFDIVPFFASEKSNSCHYVPTKSWSVSMHVVMNVIPLPLLLAGYVITIRIAYKHARKAKGTIRANQLSRREKVRMLCGIRATKKVTMIIGSYFVCVGPACVYYLLEWLCPACFTSTYKIQHEQYLHFFLKILVNVYAIISAVIFYWNSKDFRRSVKQVLSGRDKPQGGIDYEHSVSMDRRYFINKDSKIVDNFDTQSNCSSTISGKPEDDDISDRHSLNGQNHSQNNKKADKSNNGGLDVPLSKKLLKRNFIARFTNKKQSVDTLLSELH